MVAVCWLTAAITTWISSLGSGGQKSDKSLTGLKSRCSQGCVPPRGSRGESISVLLQASRGFCHSSADGPRPASPLHTVLCLLTLLLSSHVFIFGLRWERPSHAVPLWHAFSVVKSSSALLWEGSLWSSRTQLDHAGSPPTSRSLANNDICKVPLTLQSAYSPFQRLGCTYILGERMGIILPSTGGAQARPGKNLQ